METERQKRLKEIEREKNALKAEVAAQTPSPA